MEIQSSLPLQIQSQNVSAGANAATGPPSAVQNAEEKRQVQVFDPTEAYSLFKGALTRFKELAEEALKTDDSQYRESLDKEFEETRGQLNSLAPQTQNSDAILASETLQGVSLTSRLSSADALSAINDTAELLTGSRPLPGPRPAQNPLSAELEEGVNQIAQTIKNAPQTQTEEPEDVEEPPPPPPLSDPAQEVTQVNQAQELGLPQTALPL